MRTARPMTMHCWTARIQSLSEKDFDKKYQNRCHTATVPLLFYSVSYGGRLVFCGGGTAKFGGLLGR